MNSGNPQFERDFEAFLEGGDSRLDALYRKLPQPEPDAQLDAAVRALAQRAVAATARASGASQRRWLPVFAAAAVIVAAAGIATRLGPQMWQRPAPAAPAKSATAPAAPTGLPPAAESSPAPELPPSSAAESPPTPTLAPQPSPPAPMADQAPASAPAAEAAPRNLRKTENAATRQAPQAFPATAPAMREVAPAEMDRNATLYPEHWLANIRQMLQNNRREEALRSLAQFRKQYPNYRLPADLRDLH